MKRIFLLIIGTVFTYSISCLGLPNIYINTYNNDIEDEERIFVEFTLEYENDNCDYYAEIEYRGSSSQAYPKKSYSFELKNAENETINESLLGLPKENDWVLYASYNDKSLMRNYFGHEVFRQMGNYSSRSKYCNLYLNGNYRGIYILMEKIKRDDNRVNISKLNEDDISGDELTGGYIIKIDKTTGDDNDGWYSANEPENHSIYYQYHYPKASKITVEQKQYIQKFINIFEANLSETNYMEFLDLNTLIDFYIVNELSYNIDAYRLSTYFYKDKDSVDPKIKMGPMWDFDRAFGGSTTGHGTTTKGWFIEWFGRYAIPSWMYEIWEYESFQEAYKSRWKLYRKTILAENNIERMINDIITEVENDYYDNFSKWNILNENIVPYPPSIEGSYLDHVSYLRNWILDRADWIDSELGINPMNDNQNIFNEVVTNQNKTQHDEYEEFDDWIELCNHTNEKINLKGLYISDDISSLQKHKFEKDIIIEPREYYMLWADNQVEQGANHLDFKLDKDGTCLVLSDEDGNILNYLYVPLLQENCSYAQNEDSANNWFISKIPTPLKENYKETITYTKKDIKLYPNPIIRHNFSKINLELHLERKSNVKVSIYNIKGQKVSSNIFSNIDKGRNILSTTLKTNATGIYFCKIDDGEKSEVKKFVIIP